MCSWLEDHIGEDEAMSYRDDLDAARAALKVADDMVHQRDLEILALHEKMHEQTYTAHTEPSAWDVFWATSWMKTILTGFIFVNILWGTWAYYAGQPEKEELRKLQLQHDALKVKMKKERAISIMLNTGMLTIDVGDKRVLESIPLDGDFEKVLKTTTPSVSDNVTFRFTATRPGGELSRKEKFEWMKRAEKWQKQWAAEEAEEWEQVEKELEEKAKAKKLE